MRPQRKAKHEADLRSRLGTSFARARKARGLKQREVAARLGLAMDVYGRLERGHMAPSIYTFTALCAVLEVDPSFTLGLREYPPPPPPPTLPPHVQQLLQAVEGLPTASVASLVHIARHLASSAGKPASETGGR